MEALVAIAVKTGLLLVAIGAIVTFFAIARRHSSRSAEPQARLPALTKPGRIVELARALLLVGFVAAASVVTFAYS